MSNLETEEAIKATKLLTENMRAKEAAKYLGIGLSTIWYYKKIGRITAHKVSDRVTIFKRSELDALINSNVVV